jgi:hypothetical protein
MPHSASRPCPGTLKVKERKADPEILGDAKWNRRSIGQGGLGKIWRKLPWTRGLGKIWRKQPWTGGLGKM